jgi:hypothetical protein
MFLNNLRLRGGFLDFLLRLFHFSLLLLKHASCLFELFLDGCMLTLLFSLALVSKAVLDFEIMENVSFDCQMGGLIR